MDYFIEYHQIKFTTETFYCCKRPMKLVSDVFLMGTLMVLNNDRLGVLIKLLRLS